VNECFIIILGTLPPLLFTHNVYNHRKCHLHNVIANNPSLKVHKNKNNNIHMNFFTHVCLIKIKRLFSKRFKYQFMRNLPLCFERVNVPEN
jgi:hypothetical protein